MGAKSTFGLIIGNRGFFPDHLAKSGREEMIQVLQSVGIDVVVLSPEQSKHGAVETHEEAKRCAALFRAASDRIDGVIVSLPNFGDERAIADTLRLASLNVPVLIQATPDTPSKMGIAHRRDSFCGKMSACNNLKQYGIPYSLTTLHTVSPNSEEFKKDLEWFAGVCRIVKGLKNLRIGAIGARPAAFNTVRYSEKLLEGSGISVETLDLSEDGQAWRRRRRLDEGCRRANQRRAVLDFTRGKPGCRALHGHEHDERLAALQRLRGGRVRCARHARSAIGVRLAERAPRLEQQLRQRSRQSGLLSLQQPAQAFLQGCKNGFSGHHCWNRGQGEHLWHLRRSREVRPHDLRPLLHR